MIVKIDRDDLLRLFELAREGFSRGWDGLDSRDRLNEIEALESYLLVQESGCDYCTEQAVRLLCLKHANRLGAE